MGNGVHEGDARLHARGMLEAIVEDAERASDLDARIPVLALGVRRRDLAHICRENVVAASNGDGVGLPGAGV